MKAFVYCAVGDVRFKRESMYSIATLHPYLEHSLGEYRILVVTDDPGVYAPVSSYPELILLPISSQTVDDWTLQGVYMPRAKIECLAYCFEQFHCDLIFLDTDTLVLADPTGLFDALRECYLLRSPCTSVQKGLDVVRDVPAGLITAESLVRLNFYKNIWEKGFIFRGRYPISKDFIPYNSGVIGMDDASYRMLSEVLELSDCILDHYQYLCAEEFAFTYFMDAARNIVTAEAPIYHYPGAKYTRHLAAQLLNMHLGEDWDNSIRFFESYKIPLPSELQVTLADVPSFVRFIQVTSSKTQKPLQDISFEEMHIYINEDSPYFSRENLLSSYRHYYKKVRALQQVKEW